MRKLIWLLLVMMAVFMTSCLKDNPNDGTIVLLGTESDVKPIREVIPDTLLTFITNSFAMDSVGALSLPEGDMPPDIQGEFYFGPAELCADNGHGVPRNDTLYFRFGGNHETIIETEDVELHPGNLWIHGTDTLQINSDTTIQIEKTVYYYPDGQHNMKVPCDLYGDVLERGNVYQIKQQPMAYVMGNGNNFTAYFTIDYNCEFSGEYYDMKRGYIITGTISSEGIDQAVVACVNVSVAGSEGYASKPEKDWIYVYRVKVGNNKFGTAERCFWYPN